MVKLMLLVEVLLVACIVKATPQRVQIIQPTYRPPPNRGPVIRTAREANDEPQWLWKGDDIDRAPSTADHPVLPSIIDDVRLNPNRRHARSLDSPSSKRYGGGRSSTSGSRNTGPTHPGYNRRNARSLSLPDLDPWRPSVPKPYDPFSPFNPNPPHKPYPLYARSTRDIQFPGIKKPTHRDVIIPNWNPNVRSNPWDSLGGRRKSRSLENQVKEDDVYHDYYNAVTDRIVV